MAEQTQNNIPIETEGHYDNRDFRIISLSLISADGQYIDIRSITAELQIRQDMGLGFISGELVVVDATDLYSKMKLHGNEYIHIAIAEPIAGGVKINKAFRIFKVSARRASGNKQSYLISFVSDELITSNMSKVSKAYTNSKFSDVSRDILSNYLSIPDKKIDIEETTEAVDVVIPNYSPLQTLAWCASRAFNGKSHCYLFYENLDGFHFKSLHKIYESKPIFKEPLLYEAKNVDKVFMMDKFSIDSFKSVKDFDMVKASSDGTLAMTLLGIDPFHQKVTKNEYNLEELPKLHEYPPVTNPKNATGTKLFDAKDAHYLTYLQTDATSTDKKNHSEKWIQRVMSMGAIRNNVIEVVMPGSLEIQIGKTILMKFPYHVPADESSDAHDPYKSGLYLVTAVSHKFTMTGAKFDTSFHIVRDSLPKELPNPDADLGKKIAEIVNNAESR